MRSVLIDHPQIDDKQRDLLLHTERIASLEQKLEKRIGDQNELEKRLRKEVETLQHRNSELETKLVDAASMVRSQLVSPHLKPLVNHSPFSSWAARTH